MKYEYDEIEEIFEDEEDLRIARLLSRLQAPPVEADPSFRSGLRRELMREAWEMAHPAAPWWRQLLAPRGFAWGGAAAGLVAVAVLAVLFAVTQLQLRQNPSAEISEQPVAATHAIDVTFTTPMDHASAEKAIKIEPPTEVRYQWEGNTLHIEPASGSWASNVQYSVTVEQSAQSTSGKTLAQSTTVPVTTQPTPSPTPSPSPSPTATPTPPTALTDQRQLTDVSSDRRFLAWSPDGQVLYTIDAQGRLSAVPTEVGPAHPISDGGVSLASLSPNASQLVFVRAGKLWTVPAAGGAPTALASPDSAVLALGWKTGAPLWATAEGVFTSSGELAKMPADGQPLSFSPLGDRLAFRSGKALKVLDLATSAELTLPQSPAGASLLAWSPDSKRLVYQDGGHVALFELATGTRVNVNAQAAAASWSSQGRLLLAGARELFEVAGDGSALRSLSPGGFELPAWSPDGADMAFFRGGGLWLAHVVPAGGTGLTAPGLGAGRALVDRFMRARVAGSSDQAAALLDAGGQAAYTGGGPQLTASGLSRYYVVAGQDTRSGLRFVVRLIFSNGKFETQFIDEALSLQPDANGQLLVHSATASPRQDLGKGPLLTSAEFGGGQVKLQFDSDLDAKSMADAVVVTASTGGARLPAAISFDGSHTITLDTSQLPQGAGYRLTVQTTLKDVNGRATVTPYPLDFLVPKLATGPPSQGGAGTPSATPAGVNPSASPAG